MTDLVEKILHKHNIKCGNKSIGFWEFNRNDQIFNMLKNDYPLIPKFCGLF